MLGADSLYACTLLLFVVTGMRMNTGFFFEAAVVMAVMGFVTSVAFAKFLFRGEVIE